MIIIVLGFPGVGKSYFASRLAKELEADYVNSDSIRKQKLSQPTYSKEEMVEIYKVMHNAMYDHVHSRKDLVLDGTFYDAKVRQQFVQTARELGEQMITIQVNADEDLVEQRLNRSANESQADFDIYLRIKWEFDPLKGDYLTINSTDSNIKEMLKTAINYINTFKESKV